MVQPSWSKTSGSESRSRAELVEREDAPAQAELSGAEEIGARMRVPPAIYLLDRELNLVGSFEMSELRGREAEPHKTIEPGELASIVRELLGSIDANWQGGALETFRSGQVIRVLPMRGSFSSYAVLVEPGRRRDALRAVSARYGLSEREFEVLVLLVHAMTRGEIALKLAIAESTVQSHIQRLGAKLGCSRRGEIVARALGIG